jgi:hypothetical protein
LILEAERQSQIERIGTKVKEQEAILVQFSQFRNEEIEADERPSLSKLLC